MAHGIEEKSTLSTFVMYKVLEVLSKRFIENLFIINKVKFQKIKYLPKYYESLAKILLKFIHKYCLTWCEDNRLLNGIIVKSEKENSLERVRWLYTVRKVVMTIDDYILVMHIH